MFASAYKEAGVDIDAGNATVSALRPLADSTRRAGVLGSIGGFSGLFDLRAAGYQDPILVAATDGVGTKIKIAAEIGSNKTIGIDLVAMSVNDLVVQGAEPLFFLDYLATSNLDPDIARDIVEGVANGCRQAGCALIGGETAEMPGVYAPGEADLAGFAVGAVERGALLPRRVEAGDVILGLASDGAHSNGFSLIRQIIRQHDLALDAPAPYESSRKLGDALLTPTRIYVRACLAASRAGKVKALAHITGGGLVDNIARVVPEDCRAVVDLTAWQRPPVFDWLASTGDIPAAEMVRTFNCGVGMAVIVSPADVDEATDLLRGGGERVARIGSIEPRTAGTSALEIQGLDTWRH